MSTPDLLSAEVKPAVARKNWSARLPLLALVGAALGIRWLLIPVFFHGWDFPVLAWSSRIVALGDLNVYDSGLRAWVETGWNRPELSSPVSHGPLFFYLYGAWLWLISLGGLFPLQEWTSADPSGLNALHIALLKIPHLIFDGLGAFFISGIFSGRSRKIALGLWLFAPMLIFMNYAAGQNHVFMTTCVCAALYWGAKSLRQVAETASLKIPAAAYLAMLALSAGIGFKLFPIFFIVPAAIILGWQPLLNWPANFWRVGRLLAAGLLPIGLLFGVLIIFSRSFIQSVLYSWEANLLGAVGFESSGGFLSWFWVIYVALIAHLLLVAVTRRNQFFQLSDYVTYLSAVIFWYSLIAVYPAGFLVWMLPFLLVIVVQQRSLYPAYLIITLFFLLGMLNQTTELPTVWSQRDREMFLVGSGKDFLSRLLPWPQIVTLATAIFAISLVSLWGRYCWQQRTGIFYLRPLSVASTEKLAQAEPRLGLVWWLAPFVLFWAGLALVGFLGVTDSGIRKVAQEQSSGVVAKLERGTTVEQVFTAPAGQLEKIEISFATYNRYNLSKLEFKLLANTPERRELARVAVDALYIKNNVYSTFKLPKPLTLTQPTSLVFVLSSPDGGVDSSLGLFGADYAVTQKPIRLNRPAWSDLGPDNRLGLTNPLLINGQSSDQIAVFRVSYGVDWGTRLNLLSGFLGRTPFFAWVYYLLGLAVLLGSAGYSLWYFAFRRTEQH